MALGEYLLRGGQQPKEPTLAIVVLECNMGAIGDEHALLAILKYQNGFDGPHGEL